MKIRLVIVLSLTVLLLAGAATATALEMSQREQAYRASIENCLIADYAAAHGLSAQVPITTLACAAFLRSRRPVTGPISDGRFYRIPR